MSITSTTKQAADIFLERIISHAYDGAIKGILRLLKEGPPGRRKQQKMIKLHKWFQSLDEKGQENVVALIKEATKLSVFSLLTVIDNKTIGYPLSSQNSDFAIYLQTYESDEARFNYVPRTSVRINLSYSVDGDLHDEFLNILREQETADN